MGSGQYRIGRGVAGNLMEPCAICGVSLHHARSIGANRDRTVLAMTSNPLPPCDHTTRQQAHATRFALIVDAADYFEAARAAMLKARHSILLIGWDFDARIPLRCGPVKAGSAKTPTNAQTDETGPENLGEFMLWLAERTPTLEIRVLRWDIGALRTLLQGRTFLWLLRWKWHPRITLRLDSAPAFGASHHQKILVIDDSIAFCGGIDMTAHRWDTSDHRDHEPARCGPNGQDHGPWHDATSACDGDAALALGDLARTRWATATGQTLPPSPQRHDCWPQTIPPDLYDCPITLLQTRPAHEGTPPLHAVEAAYVKMIAAAKHTIYAESQYFASRRIAHAIALRLSEDTGPDVVLITPRRAEGWLEPLVMDTARARLFAALHRIDRHGRFRIYHPVTAGGADIYVHAKIMVVDDCWLRVGSSNLNNRSMRMDSECDVLLTAQTPQDRARITERRNDLLAEHLDVSADQLADSLHDSGSLIATIDALRGDGRSLVPYQMPETSQLEDWLADHEILDPNGPEDRFEPLARRGLFKGWGHLRRLGRMRAHAT